MGIATRLKLESADKIADSAYLSTGFTVFQFNFFRKKGDVKMAFSDNEKIDPIYVNCLPDKWKPFDKKVAEIEAWEAKNGSKSETCIQKRTD